MKLVDNDDIRDLVRNARIPIHVVYTTNKEGVAQDHFRMVPRFSYFDALATSILKNNSCDYSFIYRWKDGSERTCDKRFSVGVVYDLMDPDTLPWKLTLRKHDVPSDDIVTENENDGRLCGFKRHLNAIKHAEYLEHGNVTRITSLSKKDISEIERDILSETFLCPHIYQGQHTSKVVAVRIHFADGTSVVRKMGVSDSVYGIIQGIVVSRVRVGDIIYLKDVDNWIHICFPNATPELGNFIKEKKVTVTFRSVGSTPMILQNVVRLSSVATITACLEYVAGKLKIWTKSSMEPISLHFYLDGMLSVSTEEPLYNLCLDDSPSCRMTLYYSIGDAWV